MEIGVLPDFKGGKVEAENFKFVPERADVLLLNKRTPIRNDAFRN